MTYSKVWKECEAQKRANSSNLPLLTAWFCWYVRSFWALSHLHHWNRCPFTIPQIQTQTETQTHTQTRWENCWLMLLAWWQTSKSSWAECTYMFIECKETVARAPLPEQLSKTKDMSLGEIHKGFDMWTLDKNFCNSSRYYSTS